tara:strand:- start:28 stop:657 length:630 start_codon:yes stop_codon:yes gene_type:complete
MEKNKDWTGNTQSVMATLNASNHSNKDRAKNDYYATPKYAVEKLLEKESFTNVWECACGGGHISEVLKKHQIHYLSSDLIDSGYGLQEDFLLSNREHNGDIITNPPFSKSTEFTFKAMHILKEKRKLALLLRIQFLESIKRHKLFIQYPPKYIYVFVRNIRCARNGDFKNATGNASTYAWFVWEKGLSSEPIVRWINSTNTKEVLSSHD